MLAKRKRKKPVGWRKRKSFREEVVKWPLMPELGQGRNQFVRMIWIQNGLKKKKPFQVYVFLVFFLKKKIEWQAEREWERRGAEKEMPVKMSKKHTLSFSFTHSLSLSAKNKNSLSLFLFSLTWDIEIWAKLCKWQTLYYKARRSCGLLGLAMCARRTS